MESPITFLPRDDEPLASADVAFLRKLAARDWGRVGVRSTPRVVRLAQRGLISLAGRTRLTATITPSGRAAAKGELGDHGAV